jgi:hypothetical protein
MLFTFIATILVACGGGSSGSTDNNTPISFGLPNSGGAVLTIPTSTISIANGSNFTSTSITLQSGYKNLVINLSGNSGINNLNYKLCDSLPCPPKIMKNSKLNDSSNPIQVSFTPATLIAGTKDIDASISITVTGALNAGTYPINIYASYIPQGSLVPVQVQIATLSLNVNNITPVPPVPPVPPVVAGSLSISPSPTIEQIGVGYKRYVTVSLVGSQNVSSFNVTLTSSNPAVATVNAVEPQVCTLSTESNVCTIAVNGVSLGNASITASAANYTSVQSSVAVIQYAYITNEADNNYTQCTTGLSGIESGTCTHIEPSGIGALNTPFGIAFNGKYAYIVNNGNASYTQCDVDVNGIESATCVTKVMPGILINPNQVAFSGKYALFANYNSTYTQCLVSESGIISSSCTNNAIQDLLYRPLSVSINESYAYFSNSSQSTTKCYLDESGLDSNTCQRISINSTDLAFNNQGYVLTVNNNSNINQCKFDINGDFNTCQNMTLPVTINPYALAYNNDYVYFVDHGQNYTYLQCGLFESGGININNCLPITLINDTVNTAIAFH